MLTQLRLQNFKGFRDTTLDLGPLSLVIGANASGKSNLRDALRFLHGISRGYNLAEIIGEKYGEGGYREWSGLRGGAREVCRSGTEEFALTLKFRASMEVEDNAGRILNLALDYVYSIAVGLGLESLTPRVVRESLYVAEGIIFDSHPPHNAPVQEDASHLAIRLESGGNYKRMGPKLIALSHQPALTQIIRLTEQRKIDDLTHAYIRFLCSAVDIAVTEMGSMRFLDLVPDAMRRPSIPGQTQLSDQGENLSSVLQVICADPAMNESLQLALQELTPMDVTGFDFVADPQGKIIVYLVEKSGRKISAYSASDGTLRFLGILAALYGLKPAKFHFLEEIDMGIHPSRLYLLMNRLQARTGAGDLQVFTTTHSPQLLRLLDEEGLANASLAYRVEGAEETRLKSLPDIPHLMEALKSPDADIARLYEGGWMEQTMFYEEGEAAPFKLEPAESDAP